MSDALPSASLLENLRFNALVIVPNAIQGIFRRRRAAVAAATRANIDGLAYGLLAGMARSYEGPVWIRAMTNQALLILDPADSQRVLEGSPEPFASDPEAKRKGMVAFQPDALTISRGDLWRDRRRFTEAVLGAALPGLEARIAGVCREEAERLNGRVGWDDFHAAVQRIARRVILGDGAGDDRAVSEELEELMSEANGMPGEPSEHLPEYSRKLQGHLERAEQDSVAALIERAPAGEQTRAFGQVPHWLFALGDTLAINAFRALAVLAVSDLERERAAGDAERCDACLHEAMRLWPTTPMLSRETTAQTRWNGATIPAATQILIINSFSHRDRERIPYADRFAPEEWTEGDAAANPAFNHFSRGPQGCPGTALAMLVARTVIQTLISERRLRLRSPKIDPAKPMPRTLDYFGIEIELEPR